MTADRQARIEARIRERAYYLWLEEDRPHGRHDEHWRRAERELMEEEMGLREPAPATVARRDLATSAAPERSAEDTVPGVGAREHRAVAEPGRARRSGEKSAAPDQSKAKPRASRSNPAAESATGSGSRAGRHAAVGKPAE